MSNYTGLEVAIIGMSGKFPGANDIENFWENLKNGVESIEFFTPEELLEEGEDKRNIENERYVNANSYLKDKEYFDADFFGYLPDEAKLMDPQVRLFHQVCWEALEDAGCNLKDPSNKIGLFAGAASNINWEMYAALINNQGLVDDFSAFQLRNSRFLATRISYAFNLKGVSMFVDSACSTSLAAVHQACRSLLVGDCNIAIAGGVAITNKSKKGYMHQEGMINSRDGHCKAFDDDSTGTVIGEGAGVVILKSLKNAIRDRDHVYAVIRGTGINNDGDNKVGYTAPSIDGQMEAIMTAQRWAKVDPASIGYIEAHGTGTKLGDPVEIAALKKAFNTDKKQFCAVGSVKTNIGHLDTASGVAGLIKTVLALKHKQIPPSLHFKNPNKAIDFANSPFYINTKLQNWKQGDTPLRAGVSSFGIGGTNVHIVLEETLTKEKGSTSRPYQLLSLSGKTPEALNRNINKFTNFLKNNTEDDLADIAYTLQTGRESFAYRKTLVCKDTAEAIALLSSENTIDAHKTAGVSNNSTPKIAFMFSGQGSQYHNMCVTLYQNEPAFKAITDQCLTFIKEKYNKDLSTVLFSDQQAKEDSGIDDTENTQPALFIIEYALAHVLESWGITPDIMIGHSIGEYVAACISGVFTLEEALHLVVKRGELMQKMPRGKMLSIAIAEQELLPLLKDHKNISLAAVNSTELCVVSGEDDAIEAFRLALEEKNYVCRPVRTSHAFHSYMMDEALEDYKKEFANIKFKKPQKSFISNLSGTIALDQEVTTAEYWLRHLRETVLFAKGIETILDHKISTLVEVGPGKVLSYLAATNNKKSANHNIVNLVRSVKEEGDDLQHLLVAVGKLWEQGFLPQWSKYYQNEQRNKVSLPTYDFEKTSYPVNVNAVDLIKEQFDAVGYSNKNETIGVNVSSWRSSLLPNSGFGQSEKRNSFLVFSGNENFSPSVIKELVANNHKVIEVKFGAEFKEISKEIVEVNPQNISQLWHYLKQASITIGDIVYCAALSQESGTVNYEVIDDQLNQGYIDLCYIMQSLPHLDPDEKISITVFNNHIAKVFDEDKFNSLKATILAPVKIIPSEIFQVSSKLIDIPYPFADAVRAAKYLPKLINELFYESDNSPFVAYRNEQRWIPGYDTLTDNQELSSGVTIVPEGVYIITGGFGGMGFSIAQDLVFKKGANVVLLHRSAFPDRLAWTDLLLNKDKASGKEADVIQKIEALIKMEATGCIVQLHQVNVSEEAEVKNVLEEIKEQHSKINGLIWAAGEIDYGGIILNRNRESLLKYSSSKIAAVLLFEKYLNFAELDFVSLFSSIGNVFYQSKFGQVGYNAANEFLQSYAAYLEQKLNIHAFAINWCDWLNVGMTVKSLQNASEQSIENANNQIDGIYPEEGVAVFYRCLESKAVSTTVYKGNLTEAIKQHEAEYQKIKKELTLPNAVAVMAIEDQNIKSAEEIVIEVFSQFFGKTGFDLNTDFFELGGDSLKGMTLLSRINQQIGSSLSIGDLYKHSTIQALVKLLSKTAIGTHIIQIPKVPEKENYKVSSAQKRMYFLQFLNQESIAYNEIQILEAKGILDPVKIKKALEKLVQRHESLRTFFELDNGAIVQKINKDIRLHIEEYVSDREGIETIIKAFIRPFDLAVAPLFRFGIIQLSEQEHILILDMHHIITDGISKNTLISDFLTFYNGVELPDLKLQYKDYAEWQQSESEQQRIIQQKEFWLNQFSDDIPVLELPLDYVRPAHKNNVGDYVEFSLDTADTNALKTLTEGHNVSQFGLLLSIFNVLLSKVSNQEDIVIGTSMSGRLHADLEGILGMFVNVLPLRNYPDGNLSFIELLANVKSNTLACMDNQGYQFEDLIEALGIKPNASRDALFDVLFDYHNFEETPAAEISDLSFSGYGRKQKNSKFDLTLRAKEVENKIYLGFEYRTDLFKKETIEQFVNYFKIIVTTIIANKNVRLSDINILDEHSTNKLLHVFNATNVEYAADKTVLDLFEDQVAKTPDAVAVVFETKKITYKELDGLSTQMSYNLIQNYTVEKGDMVGVLLNRSEWTIITILGILKSGAVFIPVDSELPTNRQAFIVTDTALKLLVTETSFLLDLDFYEGNVMSVDVEFETFADALNIDSIDLAPTDLAYIIYTSGSTGQPKGVMIEYRSLTNYLLWAKEQYLSGSLINKNFGLFTSLSFDLTITSLFLPLISGGILKVLPSSSSVVSLLENYLDSNLSCIKLTPAHISVLGNLEIQSDKIEVAVVGGEELKKEHVEILRKINPSIKIYNEYGPTEATVGCTIFEIKSSEEPILIGKPIANTSIYILDKFNRLQPEGVLGEISIGGSGLARGYLNRLDLTSEKFIANPFIEGELLYKTGDLGKWLSNGTIDYKGRIDHQVKVRGYRIELGEIETHILQFSPAIKQVLALIKEVKNESCIVVYYVADPEIDKAELRSYLLKNLPEYMVPDFYAALKSIPLNSSGKVDRKALPNITGDDLIKKEYVAPRNEIEEKLIKIVATILEAKENEIGINDSFFDLGMNSLKLIIMVNHIKTELGLGINIAILFEFSTVNELSGKIDELINETEGDNEDLSGKEEENQTDLLEQYDDFLEQIVD
jgi:iturin family lipopeptide synthetase A